MKSLVENLEDAFVRHLLAYGVGEQGAKEHFYCEELSVEEEALMDAILALKRCASGSKEVTARIYYDADSKLGIAQLAEQKIETQRKLDSTLDSIINDKQIEVEA